MRTIYTWLTHPMVTVLPSHHLARFLCTIRSRGYLFTQALGQTVAISNKNVLMYPDFFPAMTQPPRMINTVHEFVASGCLSALMK